MECSTCLSEEKLIRLVSNKATVRLTKTGSGAELQMKEALESFTALHQLSSLRNNSIRPETQDKRLV